MKKVLVVAYSFPPVGGGRVIRITKFVKYLASFGWESVVLTVKKPIVAHYDFTLLKEIPPTVRVVRTFSLEFNWKKLLFKRRNSRENLNSCREKNTAQSLLRKVAHRLKWWFIFPDSRTGWIPFCVFRGYQLIKKEKIDVIYVNAEPFSAFISGVLLKKLTRIPLVLDFRDEWVGFSKDYFPEKPVIIFKLERIIEAWFVRNADRVTSVTESIINQFKKRFPKEKKEKFICITNGFDPQDYSEVKSIYHMREFIISYAGSLYKNRSPEYFLRAVELFLKENPTAKDVVRLRFIGSISNEVTQILRSAMRYVPVELPGFFSFKETLRYLADSSVLLYIEDQVEIYDRLLPAKIFEYMALGKPILALARSSLLREIFKQSGFGKIVSIDNVNLIKDALDELFRKHATGVNNRQIKTDFLERFDRRKLTESLSKILNSLTKSSGGIY